MPGVSLLKFSSVMPSEQIEHIEGRLNGKKFSGNVLSWVMMGVRDQFTHPMTEMQYIEVTTCHLISPHKPHESLPSRLAAINGPFISHLNTACSFISNVHCEFS